MKIYSRFFLLLILTSAASAFSQPSEVNYTRIEDGSSCWGTCLETSTNYSIVATVAHCIPDLVNGGVTVNGKESIGVFVSDSVMRSGGVDPKSTQDRGDDFALLVFQKGVCKATVRRNKRGLPQSSDASGNLIPNVAQVFKAGRAVTEVIQNYSDEPSENISLTTTNNAQMTIQDGVSGSGLYSIEDATRGRSQEYVGSLIGCVRRSCIYFSAHEENNPAATEVFEKASKKYYSEK